MSRFLCETWDSTEESLLRISAGAGPHIPVNRMDHPTEAASLVAVFDEWAPRTPPACSFAGWPILCALCKGWVFPTVNTTGFPTPPDETATPPSATD
jgi:hypothetical protein